MSDHEVVLEQVMQTARDCINDDLVRTIQCVVQLKIDMGNGNVQPFFVNVKHGSGSVDRGYWSGDPVAATVDLHAEDIHRLVMEETYYLEAFFTGRIRLDINNDDEHAVTRFQPFIKDFRALFKATLASM